MASVEGAGPPRVLVFRIGSIGDACVSVPAIKLVRRSFPSADIRVLTNFPGKHSGKTAPLRSVVDATGMVDGYFEFEPGSRADSLRLLRVLRAWKPDTVVYLMPRRKRLQLCRDWLFFKLAGARRIVGLTLSPSAQQNLPEAGGMFENEAARLLRNIRALGSIDLESLEAWSLAERADDLERISVLLSGWAVPDGFIACSVGTKKSTNDWEEPNWDRWSTLVSARFPSMGLLTIGGEADRERSDRLLARWSGPRLNVCGKLSPGESLAVMKKARLFVGHDSGPIHLAAATGVRCVGVYSARDRPGIWFLPGKQHRIFYLRTECSGCRLEVCTEHGKKCILGTPPEQVAVATIEYLASA